MPQNIALRCSSNNDMSNANFDYALIRVTQELGERIEKRRALYAAAHEQDPQLTALIFYDLTPFYFSEADLERWFEQGNEPTPDMEDLAAGGESAFMPEGFHPEALQGDETDKFYSEADRVSVTDYGVCWVCTPKHSGIEIETAHMSYDELAEALETVEVKGTLI